ncbi:Putative LOC101744750, partial [Caligus rogercresseyi]
NFFSYSNSAVLIYTDESKDEQGCTGAGWTITRGDVSIHQSSVSSNSEASVFQAEVTSITQLVIALLNQENPSKNVIIRSDSQSAIAAILNPLTKSETVKKCKETLNIGKCDININLDWCRGHSNIIVN